MTGITSIYSSILTIGATALLGIIVLVHIMIQYLNSENHHPAVQSWKLQSRFFSNYILSIFLLIVTIILSTLGLVLRLGEAYLYVTLSIFFIFLLHLVYFVIIISMVSSGGIFQISSVRSFLSSLFQVKKDNKKK